MYKSLKKYLQKIFISNIHHEIHSVITQQTNNKNTYLNGLSRTT